MCEFLLYFGRFEYALKRTGFVTGGEDRADPQWDKFSNSLRGQFATAREPEFLQAVQFLDSASPQKQVLKNGRLDWLDNKKVASESQEAWILRLVRTVRNNLFHGGKYPDTLVPNSERDRRLLEACLTVLDRTLEFSPKVKQLFHSEG